MDRSRLPSDQPAGEEQFAPPRQTIIMVEDSPSDAELIARMLTRAGDFNVRHFERIADAVAYLGEYMGDCVLLDLNLPDGAGLEAVDEVRGGAPDVPIVVLTGQDDEELAIRAVRHGAQDYLVKDNADAQQLGRAIRYAQERKRRELAELAHRGRHDALTGLPNRPHLLERVDRALAGISDGRPPIGLLFIDLDHFKDVNDAFGHAAGDQLLVDVATRLRKVVRPADMVARYGGDEFVVLCPDVSGEADAVAIARRVESELAETFVVEAREIFVTASIGIALGGAGDTTDSLIRSADAAMYHAKYGSRAAYAVFDSAMRAREVSRLDLTTNLRHALNRGQLRLHYQPMVDLATGRSVAFEALLRWQHPERGLLAAGEFIPLVEETPLISQLGDWVLHEACAELARWQRAHVPIRLSVNVSARDLRAGGLVERVTRALRTAGAKPSGLCLEITEHAVMSDLGRVSLTLKQLRSAAITIALDDFGTGSSSLSELAQLPVDVLKVDRSFIDNIDVDDRSRRVTALIIGLARTLDLQAVAEGIEREQQLAVLRDLDEAGLVGQGYLLGHPEPAAGARRRLGLAAPAGGNSASALGSATAPARRQD